MNTYRDIELSTLPSLMQGYLKAAVQMLTKSLIIKHSAGSLPHLPNKRFVLKNYQLNPAEIRKYTANVQLKTSDILPVTYLFSVAFPIVIKLLTEPDFPYVPVGLVHLYNDIDQHKSIALDAKVDIYVHVANMREHRSGLLFDVVTEVYTGSDLVWSQASTMLRRQKMLANSNSNSHAKDREQNIKFDISQDSLSENIKATAEIIREYATISGDRNPIHMSPVTAKLFGFPQMIAHGSWMMARILSSTAQQLPEAFNYKVQFGKPFFIPGSAELFVAQSEQCWLYSLEKSAKKTVILRAEIKELT